MQQRLDWIVKPPSNGATGEPVAVRHAGTPSAARAYPQVECTIMNP
jgi:hypothetical protein